MTNEKINATVEEIMEYEALLDEVKGIVDGLKDNLKNVFQSVHEILLSWFKK